MIAQRNLIVLGSVWERPVPGGALTVSVVARYRSHMVEAWECLILNDDKTPTEARRIVAYGELWIHEKHRRIV